MIPDFSRIPWVLRVMNQWVLWKSEVRDGKPTKVPYCPQDPKRKAEADNPATWGTFFKAKDLSQQNGFAGIGFEFSANDPFTGIDLDKCRDAETGAIELWARDIIKRLNSYTELSPSGRGFHILVKGKLPPGGNRKGKVEMYSQGRYFTMTGAHLEGTPTSIEDRQTELEALHGEIFGKPQPSPKSSHSPTLSLADSEIIDKALSARNGVKFDLLYRGDWQGAGFPSQSEADLAFCSILAFYTQDPGQIDRIYRASGLSREKWDRAISGSTYGAKTVEKALAGVTETYKPPKSASEAGKTKAAASNKPQQAEKPEEAPQQTTQAKPATPATWFVSGKELEALDFPEPVWIIPDILGEGYTILAGRPKLGKSWLGLCLAVAVATGGCALGKAELRAVQGKVLYLALEDRLRRIKKRLGQILCGSPFPENLLIAESWHRLDKGGLEDLKEFLKTHDDCRMVIIDTLVSSHPKRHHFGLVFLASAGHFEPMLG